MKNHLKFKNDSNEAFQVTFAKSELNENLILKFDC